MTSRSTWKDQERRVAKALGGQRIPMSGAAGEAGRLGDVLHRDFEIECKLRAKLSIYPWFKKNAEHAKETHKIPLLIVREKGARNGDLAVLRLSDFVQLLQAVTVMPAPTDGLTRLEDFHE